MPETVHERLDGKQAVRTVQGTHRLGRDGWLKSGG